MPVIVYTGDFHRPDPFNNQAAQPGYYKNSYNQANDQGNLGQRTHTPEKYSFFPLLQLPDPIFGQKLKGFKVPLPLILKVYEKTSGCIELILAGN
jgi:hypothetical protein